MLDSFHHTTLKLFCNRIFGVKTSTFCRLNATFIMDVITLRYLIYKPLAVYRLYCTALFHTQTRRHVINVRTSVTPAQINFFTHV